MGNLFYIIAIIMTLGWAVGYIGFGMGGFFHVLFVTALISLIIQVLQVKEI